MSELFKEGMIQRFEYTHELAWSVLKDFFEHAGTTNIYGSKDDTREAFSQGIITNGDGWKLETISAIQGVLAVFPQVERAILYGSRARRNFRNGANSSARTSFLS